MSAMRSVLVVGGGIGGMSAAIALRQRGIAVDLVDLDPEWRVVGAGLTITGPTLRAFARLGIIEEVAASGFFSDCVKFFQADGSFIRSMPTPTLEPGIPPAGGILRPALHHILSSRCRANGTAIHLGATVEALDDDGQGVNARFVGGAEVRYDAVIGADGFQSAVRRMIFPDAPLPVFTGQGCWRALAPRPAEVTGAEVWFGPHNYKVGINPCSSDSMYLFATLAMPGNPHIPEGEMVDRLKAILAPFGGRIGAVRDELGPQSNVNYRPLEAMLLPPPWHAGRIGLLGDAVHATTPHLASGAGLSVEDGIAIADALTDAPDVETGLQRFEVRRWERCRLVVENSLLIGRLEMKGGHDADVARLMGESVAALSQPM